MPRPDAIDLAVGSDVDLTPVLVHHPMDVEVTLTALIHYGDSTLYRRRIMSDVGFPGDDLQMFLAVNQLALRGARRPTDLAESLQTGRSNITKIVRRLVDEGLVVRIADPEDDRGVLVVLTPFGRVLGGRIVDHLHQRIGDVFVSWSDDDVATFKRLLARYAADSGAALGPAVAAAFGFPSQEAVDDSLSGVR